MDLELMLWRARDHFRAFRRHLLSRINRFMPRGPEPVEPKWPPLPPKELLEHRESFEVTLRNGRYRTPLGVYDNSLYSLYRLYEHIVLDRNIGMRNEIEYFFRQYTWPVADIPDPNDDDPARYAFLACIPHLLVLAFNENIKIGLHRDPPSIMTPEDVEELKARPRVYETVPEWSERVPPLEERLDMPYMHDGYPKFLDGMDDERACQPFKEKNILMWTPHILFI